jgi:hypothetical protein
VKRGYSKMSKARKRMNDRRPSARKGIERALSIIKTPAELDRIINVGRNCEDKPTLQEFVKPMQAGVK